MRKVIRLKYYALYTCFKRNIGQEIMKFMYRISFNKRRASKKRRTIDTQIRISAAP